MRLFIAINFDEEIINKIYDTICDVKSIAQKGNFSHKQNLHVTLVFLGQVEPKMISKVKECMNGIISKNFEIHMGGLGRFKRKGSDFYWIGIEKSETMNELHNVLTSELDDFGFDVDMREFKPHLTIGREVMCDYREAQKIVEKLGSITQPVNKISLMLSERINGKLIYTELYSRELKNF